MNGLYRRLSLLSPLKAATIVAFISFMLYIPVLDYQYVNWDDQFYVYNNNALSLSALEFLNWAFTTFELANWHPITWVSLKLDHGLWGMSPVGFHLTNIILHSMNSFLVVVLMSRLVSIASPGSEQVSSLLFAIAVGITFAVHPLHVESVAWISERKDLLFSTFYLASILVWVSWLQQRKKSNWYLYTLSFCFYVLSLMSKPMAVSLPVVLILLDVYPFRRIGQGIRVFIEKIPFVVITLASCAITLVAQSRGNAIAPIVDLPMIDRFGNAARALVFYLNKTVVPVNLSPLYQLREVDQGLALLGLASALGILLLMAFSIVSLKRRPIYFVMMSLFIVMLLPTLGIVQVGSQFAADRYMYLSMLPVIMSIIIAARQVCRKYLIPASVPITIFVIANLTLASITYNQMPYWYDSESLWRKVLKEDASIPKAHYNLANYYLSINDLRRAELEWRATINLAPTHSMAQNQLGNIEYLRGNMTNALARYRVAVNSDPSNIESRFNYAKVLDQLGMASEARLNYIQFVELATPEYQQQIAAALKRIEQIQ